MTKSEKPTGGREIPPVGGIHEAALYVEDLDRSTRFYQRVFGFELLGRDPKRHVFLRAGEDVLLLFDARATRTGSGEAPAHGASGQMHVAFETTAEDLVQWRRHFKVQGMSIEAEVEWPRGGRSLYIRDPDGHSVELVTRGIWGF